MNAPCPTDTGSVHGPTAIPYRNMHGLDEGHPHHPGLYGRYLVIDLDQNNRASRDAWAKRHGKTPASFGWGVCRHGFGLQDFRDGVMTEALANQRADALNQGRTV